MEKSRRAKRSKKGINQKNAQIQETLIQLKETSSTTNQGSDEIESVLAQLSYQ